MLRAEFKSLKTMTSLQIGGTARYFGLITSADDAIGIIRFAHEKKLPLVILGEGTNSLISDGDLNVVFGKIGIEGIRVHTEFDNSVQVEFGAGVNWDKAVKWSVDEGYSGIEALSGIPGSVGAAPIQNIGAYGADISQTLVRVRAVSTDTAEEINIPLDECEFEYRDSNFKRYPGKFIVTHVILELSKKSPILPEYKDVQDYFKNAKRKPSLKQIRNAILEIRARKLPDPKEIPNAGSFFTNPTIDQIELDDLLSKYPQMPHYALDDGMYKILAGWLIDKAGLKGHSFGHVGTYEKNALVLTTDGKASLTDIMDAAGYIMSEVRKQFGVVLEVEPQQIA